MRLTLLLIFCSIIASCTYLNPLIGYDNAFEWRHNSFIGKHLKYYNLEFGYTFKVIDRSIDKNKDIEVQRRKNKYRLFGKNEIHNCEIELIITLSTQIIQKWNYISPRSECLQGYFFEGPW